MSESDYISIHSDIWHDPVFRPGPPTARGVLFTMALLGRTLHCTARELASELGVPVRRLAQILRRLEKGGHIEVVGEGGTRTITVCSPHIRCDGEWLSGSVMHARALGWAEENKGAALWRGGNLPPAVRRHVIERDGERCHYCGSTDSPFHIDHKTAVALGGTDALTNLVVACAACNLKKSAKPYTAFLREVAEGADG